MRSGAAHPAGSDSEVADGIPLPLAWRGKVRDVYAVDEERLLLLASDRISAFDIVLDDPIPGKGVVLTQLTAWWLDALSGRVQHHLISADSDEIVALVPSLAPHRAAMAGRAMLCRCARVFPVECVVRGYISGSAWKEYRDHGTLAGEPLQLGLRESDRLDPPVFSPATKATRGHDENITVARMREIVGTGRTAELEKLSRGIFEFGRARAAERGIIVADTKFEFGLIGDEIVLVDEVLTPDSSRFWSHDDYAPGRAQKSFDKQPLRDFLDELRRTSRWNGEAPAPRLSREIITATSNRYRDAYFRITGSQLALPELP
jgi:phosphoribosylaminoimidazole-succinocarboxamide synthase